MNRGHHLQQLSCHSVITRIYVLSVVMKRISLLLSNGGPTVDGVTSRICLSKRCLAMDYPVFQESCQNIL
jgi:hypothetical protein